METKAQHYTSKPAKTQRINYKLQLENSDSKISGTNIVECL